MRTSFRVFARKCKAKVHYIRAAALFEAHPGNPFLYAILLEFPT
jgi:hypothetical protein